MAAPTVSPQDDLLSRLADSEAFGRLSGLLLLENDSDLASQLSAIYTAGGTREPAIFWAIQMALSDALGTPKPLIANQTDAAAAQDIYQEFGDGLRDYVSAVHGATQDYLSSQGLDALTLYNNIDYASQPDNLHMNGAAYDAQVVPSGITVYAQDPAIALTSAINAQHGINPALYHVIFSQQVPADQIYMLDANGAAHVLPSDTPADALYVGWDGSDGYVPSPDQIEGLLGDSAAQGPEGPIEPPAPPDVAPGNAEGYPAPPGDIYQQTWDFRDQILQAISDAQDALALRLGPAGEAVQAQIMALAAKIFHAQQNHEDVDPQWLVREAQLQRTLVDIEDALNAAGSDMAGIVQDGKEQAAGLGVDAATAQLNALLPPNLSDAGVQTQWGRPSEQALQNAVGSTQDPNSPLNMAFAAFGQAAIDLIKQGLFNGLALGKNPLEVGSQLASDVQDMSLARANNIARTEMLRDYRTANQMMYQENSDVVDGWIWLAALSTNTCAFCWAENGGFHGNDETLDSHPSCACTMLPVTGDWSSMLSDLEDMGIDESDLEEMGIDFSAIEDTSAAVPPGSEVFARLPPEDQQKVLGPSKYALYANGDLSLEDLIAHEQDPQWGGIGYEKSLKDLGFTRDDVLAAQAELARRAALGETPVVKPPEPEPELTPNQRVEEIAARIQKAEDEARAAIEAAKKPMSVIEKIKAWLQAQMKLRESDAIARDEIAAIDARNLQRRLKVAENERGINRLTPEKEAADRRALEERIRQQQVERGVGPLTQEIEDIKARQLEERLQRTKDHGPSFAAKSREEGKSATEKTYTLTADDKQWAASVREQIGPEGVLDHQQAIEIGRQIQERITEQTQESAQWALQARDIKTRAPNLTDDERAWVGGGKGKEEALAARGGVSFDQAEANYQADYRAHLVAYLGEIRGDTGGLGGELKFDMSGDKADEFVRSQLSEAAKLMPSDWIKASNDLGELAPVRNKASNSDGWYQDHISGKAEVALSYNKKSDPLAVQTVGVHELIHRMETAVPQLSRMEQDFYRARTDGEQYTKLTNGIGLKTKLDNWLDQYLGAEPLIGLRPAYHDLQLGIEARTVAHYELLTNGVDMALGHAPQAAKFGADREYERFVLGSLAGVKARPGGEVPETAAMREETPKAPRNPAPFHQVEEQPKAFAAKKPAEPLPSADELKAEAARDRYVDGKKAVGLIGDAEATARERDRSQAIRGLIGALKGNEDFAALVKHLGTVDESVTTPRAAVEYLLDQYFGYASEARPGLAAINQAVHDEFGIETEVRASPETLQRARELLGGNEDGMRAFVRAMYDQTQAYLESKGINDIVVYRGDRWRSRAAPDEIPFDGKAHDMTLDMQPVSAWSTNFQVGSSAADVSRPGEAGLLSVMRVPADRVLSLAMTGFGIREYAEVVVLGGNEQVRAIGRRGDSPELSDKKIFEELGGARRIVREPTVTASEVSVKPVKPPRVRELTAEQQAKRDAADAIKAAKAATTYTKRGEALEISQASSARAELMTAQDNLAVLERQAKTIYEREPAKTRGSAEGLTGNEKLTDTIRMQDYRSEPATKAEMAAQLEARLADNSDWQHLVASSGLTPEALISQLDQAQGLMAVATNKGPHQEMAGMIQRAVREEFGLSDARLGNVEKGGGALWDEYGKGTRAFVRAMYEETQTQFAAQGIKTVTLYRGLNSEEKPLVRAKAGDVETMKEQPLTSYTVDQHSAVLFTDAAHGALIESDVPVERILSIPQTGFGKMVEGEVIVLGGRDSVRVLDTHSPITEAQLAKIATARQRVLMLEGKSATGAAVIARVEPDPNLGGYRLTLDGQTTEGATLARVNALLKERLGFPGAVKATQVEAGPARTAAEKKAYRESGVKNATKVSKSENALTFTRPDGQVMTVERDMVNGGYKVTIGGQTTEGLSLPKANAMLKSYLGYNAPMSKEMLPPGAKPKVVKPPKTIAPLQRSQASSSDMR